MTSTQTQAATGGPTNGKQTGTLRPPLVLWAQRADKLFLTIELEDCLNPEIKLEPERLYFKGKSDSMQQDADKSEHEVTIEFYKPIKPDESKHSVRARGTEFMIIKGDAEWWPRLLKGTTKQHWLKVDFPKWKDEDDSDDEAAAAGMGGMAGMPGMAGMGGMGGMGGQPDFSEFMQQFGSMQGGAGGDMGAFGAGDDVEDDDDEEDDDPDERPPELE